MFMGYGLPEESAWTKKRQIIKDKWTDFTLIQIGEIRKKTNKRTKAPFKGANWTGAQLTIHIKQLKWLRHLKQNKNEHFPFALWHKPKKKCIENKHKYAIKYPMTFIS